jgi:hypothetical protein
MILNKKGLYYCKFALNIKLFKIENELIADQRWMAIYILNKKTIFNFLIKKIYNLILIFII